MKILAAVLALLTVSACADEPEAPQAAVVVEVGQSGIGPAQLGVIVNDSDPDSVALARYYVEKRGIPAQNLIRVRFKPGESNLTRGAFDPLRREVLARTPAGVEAYALTWAAPYRVDCMSITSAFAFGFDAKFCASGCKTTQPLAYFGSNVLRPQSQLGFRPTMSIAAASLSEAKSLVDRGVAADRANPAGTAYLASTTDRLRNVRAFGYADAVEKLAPRFALEIVQINGLTAKTDVMFYFTGLEHVPLIASNRYLPGAMADHLTSYGGKLTDSGQMSSLKWITAGATGSYGAVIEPCAFPQKFPHPEFAVRHYLQGATLIEAYWKSVLMPGQGIFIGEPLARPFGGYSQRNTENGVVLDARLFAPGAWQVESAPSPMGPFKPVKTVYAGPADASLALGLLAPGYYRVVPQSAKR